MKIHEAIETLPDGMWCRPVGLIGSAYDVVVSGYAGKKYTIPMPYSRRADMTANVEYLTGEWEFVTPEQVEQERKK